MPSFSHLETSPLFVLLVLTFSTVQGQLGYRSSIAEAEGRTQECPDGWFLSHAYCLYSTGMPEDRAEEFCEELGALQAQGVCVKKPVSLNHGQTDVIDFVATKSATQTEYDCPLGWTQMDSLCFLPSGDSLHVCSMLGGHYMFGHCVMRLGPTEVSPDFLRAVKRLDGSDFDIHSTYYVTYEVCKLFRCYVKYEGTQECVAVRVTYVSEELINTKQYQGVTALDRLKQVENMVPSFLQT